MEQEKPSGRGIFATIAQASQIISRTASSASEVLVDKELRKKAGSKLVQGIQGSIQDIGSKANAVRRNVIENVGHGLTHGRRGAQGVLEQVQAQLHQQRLKRALSQTRGQHVDIQIGFNVYLEVPQEMRSRLWLVILKEPCLAVPFQELGRFPDLGSFDMESVTAYGTASSNPGRQESSQESRSRLSESHRQGSSHPEMVPFVTQPKNSSKPEAPLSHDDLPGDTQSPDQGGDATSQKSENSFAPNLSDAEDVPVDKTHALAASSALVRGGDPMPTGEEGTGSKGAPVGRKLEDAHRRRLERQEATALKMRVSEDRIKTAIIAVRWPIEEPLDPESKYATLLQVTVGQEEVEDIISRDIHRTFPQHPQFLLGQGQEELFNVLKAYSLSDMEVGYCQGMAFVAGILLMYMPEHLAFQLFSTLMSADGPNLRRYYLDGLTDLKLEMAMFEWLLSRHHPRLARHLQEYCIPCVLYVSQWLLTTFACPFPAFFTAQLIDIMLLENSDRIIMQTCMAIMAEVEERLLRADSFEDIITCLKTEPAQWSDDKLRGLLTAAYLSSVSEEELQLARRSVETSVAASSRKGSMAQEGDREDSLDTQDTPGHSQQDPLAVNDETGPGEDTGKEKQGSVASLEEFADIMKQELEQLTWAGPSGEESGTVTAGSSRLGLPLNDPKMWLSGEVSRDNGGAFRMHTSRGRVSQTTKPTSGTQGKANRQNDEGKE